MTAADRKRLHAIMGKLIAHHAQLDYPLHDVRGKLDAQTFALTWPQAVHRLDNGGRLMFDCSGCVTCTYKWAGLKDPNGLGYRHVGYTGTMLAHLPHYTNAKRARVGALVVFGPATGEHVAMVYTADKVGGDPLLFSHGARGLTGPIRLHREARFHDPPVTLLSVSSL
jgi:hypothetical protein